MIYGDPYYSGWLGNQMFQYAAIRAYTWNKNFKFGYFQKSPNLFEIFPNLTATRLNIEGTLPECGFEEQDFTWNFIRSPDECFIKGYFQSEKYFKFYKKEILREFRFSEDLEEINAVSIHVRKGDYKRLKEYHTNLGMDYYTAAMNQFDSGTRFIVISDEPEEAKVMFNGFDVEVVTGNSPIEDMRLMASCSQGHIIANSSFSWWGAYLGKGSKTVAPKNWFGPAKPFPTKDLYCENWIVV